MLLLCKNFTIASTLFEIVPFTEAQAALTLFLKVSFVRYSVVKAVTTPAISVANSTKGFAFMTAFNAACAIVWFLVTFIRVSMIPEMEEAAL